MEKENLKDELEKLKKENESLKNAAKIAMEESEAAKIKLKEQSEILDRQVARQEEEIARQLKAQRKVRLIIASGRDSHERCPVPIGVNGREYLIERDKEVLVPEAVVNVLALAETNVCEMCEEDGRQHMAFRPANRFSYRVLGYVDEGGQAV